MNLTPEQKTIGKDNFYRVLGTTRRDFLKGGIAAGVASGAGLGAMYFGYEKSIGKRLRVGIIGTGDEGNVLIGALNPNFIDVVAIADIRPYNRHRAFYGDHASEGALAVRPGLMTKYNWSYKQATDNVKVYDDQYESLLNNPDVEAVIIALPLHLHAPAAIAAMKKGKHVLTEKLMGHSVHKCKDMARVAQKTNMILAVGHQRHYSILYANAVDTIKRGLLGDLHSIRAQWHRAEDSWMAPLPEEILATIAAKEKERRKLPENKVDERNAITNQLSLLTLQLEDHDVKAEKYGYLAKKLENGQDVSALAELIRWRLWKRTGGGLMAELGSHQLDASGIFATALRTDGKKALPLSVQAMGGRYISTIDRECEDHVYCMFEYPGAKYATAGGQGDKNSKVGVTYSSINGNGFGGYGEAVMGTAGTLVLEREQEVMLFRKSDVTTSLTVEQKKGLVVDTTATGGGEAAATAKAALEKGPVSRGYTEEIEHWAWCIRNRAPENKPRCHPEVAMADAVIALTTNIAMRENRRIEFEHSWFVVDDDATPEGVKPSVKAEA